MKDIHKYNNEKGFALILALSMLAILSILGVFALNTSTTEVQISGNYSASQHAFFAADRVVDVVDATLGDLYEDLEENVPSQLTSPSPGESGTDYLARTGNSGLVSGNESSVRLVYSRPQGMGLYDVYFATSLTGGVFPTAASNEPRQRARIETYRVLAGSYLGDGEAGSGSSSGSHFQSSSVSE